MCFVSNISTKSFLLEQSSHPHPSDFLFFETEMFTGFSENGRGGDIEIGTGASQNDQRGVIVNGSDITMLAGHTTSPEGYGGTIRLGAGSGLSEARDYGGRGGNVEVEAGNAAGPNGEQLISRFVDVQSLLGVLMIIFLHVCVLI